MVSQNPIYKLTLASFTLAFVPFSILTTIAIWAAEIQQDVPLWRAIYTAWLWYVLVIPALSLYAMGIFRSRRYTYWVPFWSLAYIAYAIHVYFSFVVVFEGSFAILYQRQGAYLATANLVITLWWTFDVLVLWTLESGKRWIRIERLLLHVLLLLAAFYVGVLRKEGVATVLGIIMAVAVLASLLIRVLFFPKRETGTRETTAAQRSRGLGWSESFFGGNAESERKQFKRFADLMKDIQRRNSKQQSPAPVRRGLHAKIQAGVSNATFHVANNIPEFLCDGLFQPGANLQACVRFSNASGQIRPDASRDLRGLAIRLSWTDSDGRERFTDMLMTNAPVSHARNAKQFLRFAVASSKHPRFLFPLRLLFSVGPVETIRMLRNVIGGTSRKVESLAKETYWSRAPFRIKNSALRFFVAPDSTSAIGVDSSGPNYLKSDLATRLQHGSIKFRFYVQLFVDDCKTPIEDAAVAWKEKDSAPIQIAELRIPQQDITTPAGLDVERIVDQMEFNPWNGSEKFQPLGQLNRARQAVYQASANYRHGRVSPKTKEVFIIRLVELLAAPILWLKRWDRLPVLFGILSLAKIREKLRKCNLYDTETTASRPSDDDLGEGPSRYKSGRSPDGSFNDLSDPRMGQAGTRFGRNIPLDKVHQPTPEEILTPNPRTVANDLMTRNHFKPATTLNLLAASWIQFMVHGWFAHRTTNKEPYHEITIDSDGDDWPQDHRPMKVRPTLVDPKHKNDPEGHPTPYNNRTSHWWDGSQLYGSDLKTQKLVRSKGKDGKLAINNDGLLPKRNGIDVTGVNDNWWLGLGLMHTIFTLEHNAICDCLQAKYPDWSDDKLFDTARLVNTALMAKIHTVEWTPGILGHPTLQVGMRANWWGLVTEQITNAVGRLSDSESISGIIGSPPDHHAAPYSLTEEFVSVYRMHPLMPDDFIFRQYSDDRQLAQTTLENVVAKGAREIMENQRLVDLIYSFGIAHPGAITLQNFPKFLRKLKRQDGRLIDLAAVDILRDRERGVPRYNDFRESLRLPRIKSFDALTPDKELARQIEQTYGSNNIDQVDLIVGMLAEEPPRGFGFSDTAFRIFVLMATRRLKSDRFFTTDYRPEIYTPEGIDWVADNTMITVLLRHYPELGGTLRTMKNAFAPWPRTNSAT